MEVIENATQLKARLLDAADDPARPGWQRLNVEVLHATAAGDLPSLIDAQAGEVLTVLVPPTDRARTDGLAAGAAIGMQLRLRAPGVHTLVPGTLVAE